MSDAEEAEEPTPISVGQEGRTGQRGGRGDVPSEQRLGQKTTELRLLGGNSAITGGHRVFRPPDQRADLGPVITASQPVLLEPELGSELNKHSKPCHNSSSQSQLCLRIIQKASQTHLSASLSPRGSHLIGLG